MLTLATSHTRKNRGSSRAPHMFLFLGFSNFNAQYTFIRLSDMTSTLSSNRHGILRRRLSFFHQRGRKGGAAHLHCAVSTEHSSSWAEEPAEWATHTPSSSQRTVSFCHPRIVTSQDYLELVWKLSISMITMARIFWWWYTLHHPIFSSFWKIICFK